MRKIVIIATLLAIFICIYLFRFNNKKQVHMPPELISKNCFWIGGHSGGYWVEIIQYNKKDSITVNLYLETSGDSVGKFTYIAKEKNNLPFNLKDETVFVTESQFQIKSRGKYYNYTVTGN